MAEKRFISRRITESDKNRSLANAGKLLATNLYSWLLPYLDKQGRMNANPMLLKGGMFEGYVFTIAELEEAIMDLAAIGLVRLYRHGKYGHLIQYQKFLTSDGGFNTPHEREPASDLPGPDDAGSVPVERVNAPQQAAGTMPATVRDEYGTKPVTVPAYIDVEIEIDAKTEVEKEHTSITKSDNPGTNLAAAPPRVGTPDVEKVITAYNDHRGKLPAARATNSARRRKIASLIRDLGPTEAIAVMGIAAAEAAQDKFWLDRQYGLDNLLNGQKAIQKAESALNRGTVDRAQAERDRLMRAIQGSAA